MSERAIAGKSASALGWRYVKFCLVGGSGVAVDMVFLYLLADGLGWNLTVSKVIAAEVALVNNFLWNDAWTFRELGEERRISSVVPAGNSPAFAMTPPPPAGRWRHVAVRLGKFNLICLAGIGLSVLLLNGMVHGLNFNVYLANFLAIVAVSLWNFFLNLKFGWNSPASRDHSPESR